MLVLKEIHPFHGGDQLTRRDKGEVKTESVDQVFDGAIPLRYRHRLGGVDIERVRQDQRQARRQFLRAIIKYLYQLWRR